MASLRDRGPHRLLGRAAALVPLVLLVLAAWATPSWAVSPVCGSPQSSGANMVVTCSYTGGLQTFSVPAHVNFVTLSLAGGQGGDTQQRLGGLGGQESGTISVTP